MRRATACACNLPGLRTFGIAGSDPLPPGEARLRLDFAHDGGGPGKGGQATLHVNDKPVAEGGIENTQAAIFSADETADVGVDLGTAVVEAVGSGEESHFTGDIPRVTLTLN